MSVFRTIGPTLVFIFLLRITAADVVPNGGRKKSSRMQINLTVGPLKWAKIF